MRSAIAIAPGIIPMKGLRPSMNASAIPGSAAWASASPMKPRPLVTTYAPTAGHIIPTMTDTISALTMKLYSKGVMSASVITSIRSSSMNRRGAVRPVQLFQNLSGENVARSATGAYMVVDAQTLVTIVRDMVNVMRR